MKLTVLTWLRDASISIIGRFIELLFRAVLLLMPMGVFIALIQFRDKASKISSISAFTSDESTWQHIFPGFLLVAIDPDVMKKAYKRVKNTFQFWINDNKYSLGLIFMILIVTLMILKG